MIAATSICQDKASFISKEGRERAGMNHSRLVGGESVAWILARAAMWLLVVAGAVWASDWLL